MTDDPPTSRPDPGRGGDRAGAFCSNCGAALPSGARFCTKCGTPSQAGATVPPPPPPAEATRVLPSARVAREERVVEEVADEAPVYRGPPPPGFNWVLAILALLGVVVLALGLALFLESQDDDEEESPDTSTTLVPLTVPTAPTTLATLPTTTSTTLRQTTTTAAPTTTTSPPTTAPTTVTTATTLPPPGF